MIRRNIDGVRIVLSITMVGFAVSAAAEQQVVNASELVRCAAVAGGNERLACFEALTLVAAPGVRIAPATVSATAGATDAAATSPAAPQRSDAPASAPVARADAVAPPAAGQATPPARSANPDDPVNFGLTKHQLKVVVPAGPDSVKATVSQITEDRLSHVSLVLDNGQTWGFTGPNPRVRPGDTVTIKRAALGSFLMLTPSRHSYRVERLN
jgi:hypothetical protein